MAKPRRLILRFVLQVVSYPKLTLGITLLLTAVCILLACTRLSISSDQNKLFSSNVPFFRDFIKLGEEFPENEAIYVIIEPHDPKGQPPVGRWAGAAEAIVQRLSRLPKHVVSVTARVPPAAMGAQGLLFEDPVKLRAEVEETRRFVPLLKIAFEKPNLITQFAGPTPSHRLLTGLAALPNESAPLVHAIARSWTESLAGAATTRPVLPDLAALGADDPERLGYFYMPDETDRSRHLLLVRVVPREDYTSLTAISETVEAIRDAVAEAARPFPEFEVGVTGRPALDADEMRTTDTDSTRAEIVALSAVFIGVALLLRSLWLTIAAEMALGVGIAWTFAWATVTLGELNLLSIVFMLALIGIGMDYLIQILSRYRREIALRRDPRRVWIAVFKQVGAPINTATLGAAGAFLVSLFTGFQGAADLGLIAGGGLILCLLAGYTFLPALLTLWPCASSGEFTAKARRREGMREEDNGRRIDLIELDSSSRLSSRLRAFAVNSVSRRQWRGPLIWLVLLLIGIPFALRTRFDPGLIELQAPNLRSVQLIRKLQTWSAVVLSRDLSSLHAARDALAGAQSIDHTESILNASDNYALLTQEIAPLPAIEWVAPDALTAADIATLSDKADAMAAQWAKLANPSAEALAATAALRDFAAASRKAPPDVAAARLGAWQVGFIDELRGMLATFHPSPPDWTILPPALRDHLVSPAGVFALHIYPREDLWDQDALDRFVTEIEPRLAHLAQPVTLTGIAHNIHHSTAAIRSSFIRSTLYALALILLLVWLDLRRVPHTLAAVSVLALGLPMLVALMGLFHIDWNFANFFGLPILIGAGHEYGVFLVHRYREAASHPRRGWRGWDVADKALLLCAFVTSSCFGFFFLLAHHRGLKSLGLVMALGSACIYLAGLVVVRPILKAKLENRSEKLEARSEKEGVAAKN